MDRRTQEQYIHGSTLLLSNRYQIIGDRMGGDVTMKQWILLIIVDKIKGNELNINRLADFMGYSRQNAAKIIAILEKKGYVRLTQSKKDKRSKSIELTEKTYKYFKENGDVGDRLLDKTFAGVTDEEVAVAFGIIMKLMENASAIIEEKDYEEFEDNSNI